ncbi:hypothetical protein BDV95DRAFT_486894 [Massariosphaeria phaeospora]|uniref:AB hydrolase-1 domain-containing protein n=1 Tax=Massariosphaeria phaeospora TaxID=100035 RepID=A0A7C8MF08_9PLEO|nr:hypothetical protein BDV95DRAFT_486894 [Massariosphaeria phaeospora]
MSTNSSEVDLPPFPTPEISTIVLAKKPSARIHYTYYPPSKPRATHPNPFAKTLVVFLNGLLLPRASWDEAILDFFTKRISSRLPYPALLSYDRYGQGNSDPDPDDAEPPPSHGHDAMSAVYALHQLILQVWTDHPDTSNSAKFPCLIFVGNSIGCAIARLFARQYPHTVSGLLFLDSIIANSDLVSMWPNPDAPGFDPHTLPSGVSERDVRDARERYRHMFHPDVASKEGLSRRNLAQLLPEASAPRLEGYGGEGPYLTVVGHDSVEFAEQSSRSPLSTPMPLTLTYLNPVWQSYNEGLTRITDPDKAIGPITAVGCGHFVQQDGPGFVGDEMVSLLDRVVNRVDQEMEGGLDESRGE